MRVLGLTRGDCEPFVPAFEETVGERLRLIDAGDAGQAHLLDQPILQGPVGALHPTLGLRGRGVNELDAQPLGDAAELGQAVAALRLFGVDAENAVPIRIEGQRQAVRQHVRLQRLQIGLGGLRRGKLQTRQPPGGVVDEHDQRAARPPALEPIVRAPVDLDEFAKARPAFANLEDLLGAPPPGPPEPQPDLDLPDRLLDTQTPSISRSFSLASVAPKSA